MAGLRRAAALLVALVALGSLASAELVVREVHTDVRAGLGAARLFRSAKEWREGVRWCSDRAIGRIAIRGRAAGEAAIGGRGARAAPPPGEGRRGRAGDRTAR